MVSTLPLLALVCGSLLFSGCDDSKESLQQFASRRLKENAFMRLMKEAPRKSLEEVLEAVAEEMEKEMKDKREKPKSVPETSEKPESDEGEMKHIVNMSLWMFVASEVLKNPDVMDTAAMKAEIDKDAERSKKLSKMMQLEWFYNILSKFMLFAWSIKSEEKDAKGSDFHFDDDFLHRALDGFTALYVDRQQGLEWLMVPNPKQGSEGAVQPDWVKFGFGDLGEDFEYINGHVDSEVQKARKMLADGWKLVAQKKAGKAGKKGEALETSF